MNSELTTVDIITSAFNEEDCVPELFRRLDQVFSKEKEYRFRTLIVDNGSTDNTWEIIKAKSLEITNVIGLRMSRNFSLDAAFTCG